MPPVLRDDPYPGYNFLVQIQGVSEGGSGEIHASFAEVSGLGVEITPIEYRTGAEDITVRKLPGLKKFSNVTLKRGITGNLVFWEWIKQALDGKVLRTNVSIVLLDEAGDIVLRFLLKRAWPVRFEGPNLNATANEVAVEVLEICHEGLEIE